LEKHGEERDGARHEERCGGDSVDTEIKLGGDASDPYNVLDELKAIVAIRTREIGYETVINVSCKYRLNGKGSDRNEASRSILSSSSRDDTCEKCKDCCKERDAEKKRQNVRLDGGAEAEQSCDLRAHAHRDLAGVLVRGRHDDVTEELFRAN